MEGRSAGTSELISPTPSPTPTSTGVLSQIPIEILDRILVLTDPQAVSAFSQTTRTFQVYIDRSIYIWRSLYINYFDDPRGAGHPHITTELNWKREVQTRTHAYRIANSSPTSHSTPPSPDEIEHAAKTIIRIIQTSTPGTQTSNTIAWLHLRIPPRFIWPGPAQPLTQARAQLQVLKCECQTDVDDRLVSRSYVYDMRNYSRDTLYGPFLPRKDREAVRVNYVHLRHLMNVQFNNIRYSHSHSDESDLWMPRGFSATRAMTAPPSSVVGDWAGVEGDWMRFVSWMGYGDLEEYNWPDGEESPPGDIPLDNSIFSLEEFTEAHAFLRVTLHVIGIEPDSENPSHRPRIHFEGTTAGGGMNESRVKGYVADEGQGVIRWSLDSIVGGRVKWSTSGTQIGGVQSAAGWIGCWSSPEHSEWDPAGPNWTYKRR